MPNRKLQVHQAMVDEAATERTVSMHLQQLKYRADQIEILEIEDYEHRAEEEEDLPDKCSLIKSVRQSKLQKKSWRTLGTRLN